MYSGPQPEEVLPVTMQTTYTDARKHLAALLDRAGEDHETIVITRRDRADVALIAADELRSLEETAHLFRSPANARRLLEAMERAEAGRGEVLTVEELRGRVGLLAEDLVGTGR